MMEVEKATIANPLQYLDSNLTDEELYLKVKELQSDIDLLKI